MLGGGAFGNKTRWITDAQGNESDPHCETKGYSFRFVAGIKKKL